ncbi:hypothetical protein HI853_02345 [Cyanobacteria bacterium 150SLHA]|uniref:hypothetical protein n=1 Tax=Prochlorococcus sp.P1363 TaxID=2729590 RepID=UPI00145EB59F|nr:hypothetical protein [Prochlorococcus sp.P1363]NMP12717.1 hypothetical protein [Prochlorococcus sp.P1363]
MLPPANTDLLARELSELLDGSACLQIMLPALARVEAGQVNEQGQGQTDEHGDGHEHGQGQALSRWRGLRR